MLDEIRRMPRHRNRLTGQEYDRIIIVTVEELLEGNLPMSRVTRQAKTNKTNVETEDLLD